jgi:hypothetical protein
VARARTELERFAGFAVAISIETGGVLLQVVVLEPLLGYLATLKVTTIVGIVRPAVRRATSGNATPQ